MIRLRAHHLLCLEQFRGYGYSPAFVANFARVQEALAQPGAEVQLVTSPDAICRACPRLDGRECARGPEVLSRDSRVLAGLGLAPGTRIAFRKLLELFTSAFPLERRLSACHGCTWLEDGICYPNLQLRDT